MDVMPPTSDVIEVEDLVTEEEADELEPEASVPATVSAPSLLTKHYKEAVWPELDESVARECAVRIKEVTAAFSEEIDQYDTTMVSEYSEDIMKYMGELELSTMPIGDYIANQTEITWCVFSYPLLHL